MQVEDNFEVHSRGWLLWITISFSIENALGINHQRQSKTYIRHQPSTTEQDRHWASTINDRARQTLGINHQRQSKTDIGHQPSTTEQDRHWASTINDRARQTLGINHQRQSKTDNNIRSNWLTCFVLFRPRYLFIQL